MPDQRCARRSATGVALAGLAAFALPGLAACALPVCAAAQTQSSAESPSLEASKDLVAGPTETGSEPGHAPAVHTPEPPLWSLTASGGVSSRDDGPDGSWQALALSRRIGRGYVRASAMRYNGTLIQANTALPSDYYIGTLAAGGNIDNWVADAWASYGRQVYGRITTETGSRESTGARSSAYYAVGADFGRIFTLSPSWYVTPTVAASYAHGKLLRAAPEITGFTDLETNEPTLSASATVRVDHAFGKADNHYIGLLASRHVSSNGLSQVVLGELDTSDGTPLSLDSIHHADGWFEAGATGSMQITRSLNLDLYATRSFGVAAGNMTSAGLSLRKAF